MSTDIEALQQRLAELEEVAREVAEHDCSYCPGGPYDPEWCWPEQRCPVGWLRRVLDQKQSKGG